MPSRPGAVASLLFRTSVGVASLVIAIAAASWLAATRELPTPRPAEEARPRLIVLEASPVEVQRTFRGFGTADSEITADVPAEVSGVIDSIPEGVRTGRAVGAGQVLMTIDPEDFRRQAEISAQMLAELDAQGARLDVEESAITARAALAASEVEIARAELARTEEAIRAGGAIEREAERARQALIVAERSMVQSMEARDQILPRRRSLSAQLEMQRASKRLAEQNLARAVITSPIDGILASVDVEVGESVAPGRRVARVVNLSRIEVPLKLPSSARAFIRVGDGVRLERDADRAQDWDAVIARISPVDEPGSRTFTAYAELTQSPEDPEALVPGTFVLGTVRCGEPSRRIAVPRRSVRDGRILVVEPDAAGVPTIRARPVEVAWTFEQVVPESGVPDSQWVVLAEDPSSGSLILLDATRAITPGTAVRPVIAGREAPTAVAGPTAPTRGSGIP